MSNKFTDKAEHALNSAIKFAEDYGHTYIGSEHLLLALAREEQSTASLILIKYNLNEKNLDECIKTYSGKGEKSSLTPKDMTPCCKKIIESSYKISLKYGSSKIGTEHILLAIIEEKNSVAVKILNLKGIDVLGIIDEVQTLLRTVERTNTRTKNRSDDSSFLKQYGKNLLNMVQDGLIDPVIGREKETERLIRILCRKTKNNPCLIGEAGVGKTAIVEGLAHRIVKKDVPLPLINKELISVDLTSMVSGTKYRGDFEERIKSLINEAANNKNVILFIDEIHTIVGAGAAEGAIDAANILKPQLSRGEIQLIGATTFTEYHKYIERDAALERRFQPITVNEPDEHEAIIIISGVKERYEKHHNVLISDDAVTTAVQLSARYIRDRYLPDKALDVIDEACAKLSSENTSLFSSDGDEIYRDNPDKNKKLIVTPTKIKEILNEMTGIPITGIGKRMDPNELKKALSESVIGQNDAIDALTEAVMKSELGINDPDKPKGVFMFIGNSGVGKTELAKRLALELFRGTNSLLTYDMSEYSEKNAVNKFIGSPPGYVGYEEGGILTEKIRRNPYSVILFDEIEKAHPDVIDLFLQITDSGALTDSQGRKVNFKNCYIIFTSNIGSGKESSALGFVEENSKKRKKASEILESFFRTEFINRLDEIIFFSPLSKNDLIEISKIKLNELAERLKKINVKIIYSDSVAENIAERCKEAKFGAREVIRVISTTVENSISRYLFNVEIKECLSLYLTVLNNEILISENDTVLI